MLKNLSQLKSRIEKLEGATVNKLPDWAQPHSQGALMVIVNVQELGGRIAQSLNRDWYYPPGSLANFPKDFPGEAVEAMEALGDQMLRSGSYANAQMIALEAIEKLPRYRYHANDIDPPTTKDEQS